VRIRRENRKCVQKLRMGSGCQIANVTKKKGGKKKKTWRFVAGPNEGIRYAKSVKMESERKYADEGNLLIQRAPGKPWAGCRREEIKKTRGKKREIGEKKKQKSRERYADPGDNLVWGKGEDVHRTFGKKSARRYQGVLVAHGIRIQREKKGNGTGSHGSVGNLKKVRGWSTKLTTNRF